jgi:hypothetical protein
MGFEVLCFGDFHLDPQMKVTRPPGRDPACNALNNTAMKRAEGERQQRAKSRSSIHAVQAARTEQGSLK